MTRILRLAAATVLALAIGGCGDDDDDGGAPIVPPPDLITFDSLNLQPEGVEYDVDGQVFVVGSATRGSIHTVDDEGNLSVLVADPGLVTTLGLRVDRERNRLLAAGSFAEAGRIGLGIYDLATGEAIRIVDISAAVEGPTGLANDVVIDSAGTAYVTDTTGGAVYAVDVDGNVETVLRDGALALANGIEVYQDEWLLVATIGGPSLLRIPIDDPSGFAAVDSDVAVPADGMVFTADGDLAAVTIGGVASVILLSSDDDWETARLTGTWDSDVITGSGPTTAALRGDDVYVVFPRLFNTENSRNDIERVVFDSVD